MRATGLGAGEAARAGTLADATRGTPPATPCAPPAGVRRTPAFARRAASRKP
jgi:hypothetical protein